MIINIGWISENDSHPNSSSHNDFGSMIYKDIHKYVDIRFNEKNTCFWQQDHNAIRIYQLTHSFNKNWKITLYFLLGWNSSLLMDSHLTNIATADESR